MIFIVSFFTFFLPAYMAINEESSSRYEKRYLSEKDISRFDDEVKALVLDFLEKNGKPITEEKFDSIVDSMNQKKAQMKAEAERAGVLSSQRKACE